MGTWENTHVSFGAMGDSWYEYLLKVWVQGGRTKAMKGWHDMWEESMRAMIDKLVFDGEEAGTKYVAEFNANHAVHKMVSHIFIILLLMAIRLTSCVFNPYRTTSRVSWVGC